MRSLKRSLRSWSRSACAVVYVGSHFTDPTLSLRLMGLQLGMTPGHVGALLKRHTGRTFLQHLRALRVTQVTRLLITTTGSHGTIAAACGYLSKDHFYRDFRRVHGCTPTVWRAQQEGMTKIGDRS